MLGDWVGVRAQARRIVPRASALELVRAAF